MFPELAGTWALGFPVTLAERTDTPPTLSEWLEPSDPEVVPVVEVEVAVPRLRPAGW
jgi:hypothetical protein